MADLKVADSKANEEAHWDKTTKLMFTHLGVWFFFGYVIHMFVVMLFMFAKQQNRIDREHGYAEED